MADKYMKVSDAPEYGAYYADGDLVVGCVKLTGDMTVAQQDDGTKRSHGHAVYAREDKANCVVTFGSEGYLETDNYSGSPAAGDLLIWDESSKCYAVYVDSGFIVGEVMSVSSGVIKFKSLI